MKMVANPPMKFSIRIKKRQRGTGSYGGVHFARLGVEVMSLLSQDEFAKTFGETRERLLADESPPFDFWQYFDEIPLDDFEGHDCSAREVEYVYRMGPAHRYVHVLVNTEDRNVFMVIVLDIVAGDILGHRLLNLNREYGLDEG